MQGIPPTPLQTRRRGALTSFLIAASFVGCQDSAPPPEGRPVDEVTPDQTEVHATLESYYDAFSARDWSRFEEHFWDGATMTTVWAPPGETAERVVATSIPDFVAQAPDGPGSREIFEERMLSANIVVEGDLAQAQARYHARFGDPGEIMEWEGMDVFTLVRFGGEWRISSMAFLPDSD